MHLSLSLRSICFPLLGIWMFFHGNTKEQKGKVVCFACAACCVYLFGLSNFILHRCCALRSGHCSFYTPLSPLCCTVLCFLTRKPYLKLLVLHHGSSLPHIALWQRWTNDWKRSSVALRTFTLNSATIDELRCNLLLLKRTVPCPLVWLKHHWMNSKKRWAGISFPVSKRRLKATEFYRKQKLPFVSPLWLLHGCVILQLRNFMLPKLT